MCRFVVALTGLLLGCGALPDDLPDTERELERVQVRWWVRNDRRTAWCSARGDDRIMEIEDFPWGWYCYWSCASYQGRPQQVYLDVAVENTPRGKRFVPADQMPVYTARCDQDLDCPSCNFE